MSVCESAAIIGLGLIGGSLARDLAAHGVKVSAYDASSEHVERAKHDGVLHDVLNASLSGVADAEVVVVAVPVDSAIEVLRRLAPYAGNARLVTDVGSTKARIGATAVEVGLGERFVGSHPLAGGHRSGWAASSAGLFVNAPVYLCPTAVASEQARCVAGALWSAVGARPLFMDADAHDRQLAWTSHLPHIVSTAVALALAGADVDRNDLGPGGRDITRLAGSSPDVWTAIAHDNAAALDDALAAAEAEIAKFRSAIARSDLDALRDRFSRARDWFDDQRAAR